MRVLHLAGGRLGDRVGELICGLGDEVVRADDLDSVRSALGVPTDHIVSAGFRHIIPADLLARAGEAINVHTGLLPWVAAPTPTYGPSPAASRLA